MSGIARKPKRSQSAFGQRIYIDVLLANGPLREGLTPEDAAATYSALSNPSTHALLLGERGWSADHFERWLGDSLTRLLLPQVRIGITRTSTGHTSIWMPGPRATTCQVRFRMTDDLDVDRVSDKGGEANAGHCIRC
jgi:hypothetical protein